MFAQPFFTASPLGSRRPYVTNSYYPDYDSEYDLPYGRHMPAYYEAPLGFGYSPANSQPFFPSYASRVPRQTYDREESTEEETDSSEEEVSDSEDVCTCGRCYLTPTVPSTQQRMMAGKSASGRKATNAQSPAASRRAAGSRTLPTRSTADARRPVSSMSGISSTRRQPAAASSKSAANVPPSPHQHEAKKTQATVETEEVMSNADLASKNASDDESSPRTEDPVATSLLTIATISNETGALREEVDAFAGPKGCKDYLRLEDQLTRVMLRLDMVESYGDDNVRMQRREAVRNAQACVDTLEGKVAEPADEEAPIAPEVEEEDTSEQSEEETADQETDEESCELDGSEEDGISADLSEGEEEYEDDQ